MNVFEAKRTGKFCDLQGLYRQGREYTSCLCIQMTSRLNVPCIAIVIGLTTNGDELIVCDYSSLEWMNNFLFKGEHHKSL